jgi:MFS family permease
MYNFIDRFTVGFFVTSFNLHLREGLGFHPGKVGLYLSLVLLPMSILSYPFAILARKIGPFLLMMVGSCIYGISLGLAGFLGDNAILFILLLTCGAGAGVMFVPSMMMAVRLAPPGLNASVMAGFTGFGSVGFLLGPIVSTLLESYLKSNLASDLAFGVLSMVFGSLEIIIVLFTLPFYKHLKERII